MIKVDGIKFIEVSDNFRGIQQSMLLNLSLPVFVMMGEAMQCTKLLINQMHGGSLWLDKEYQTRG